jgi:hypothetical protein
MRFSILAALAALALVGCGRRPPDRPMPKTNTIPAGHFGQNAATQNTLPGLDAFGAGTGGSGQAQTPAFSTKHAAKGAGWFPTVSTNGTGRSSAADRELIGQKPTEAMAPTGRGLSPTGQGMTTEFGGVSSQLGMSPDRPGIPNAAGISGSP